MSSGLGDNGSPNDYMRVDKCEQREMHLEFVGVDYGVARRSQYSVWPFLFKTNRVCPSL